MKTTIENYNTLLHIYLHTNPVRNKHITRFLINFISASMRRNTSIVK